jgi:hypothetical protein
LPTPHLCRIDPHGPQLDQAALLRGEAAEVANPVLMASTGCFIVLRNLLPKCAIGIELAGEPLFLDKDEFETLIKPRKGSPAERQLEAKRIIHKYLDENPGGVMTKKAFRAQMRKVFPDASFRSLDADRLAVMLKWRHDKGGRPRG